MPQRNRKCPTSNLFRNTKEILPQVLSIVIWCHVINMNLVTFLGNKNESRHVMRSISECVTFQSYTDSIVGKWWCIRHKHLNTDIKTHNTTNQCTYWNQSITFFSYCLWVKIGMKAKQQKANTAQQMSYNKGICEQKSAKNKKKKILSRVQLKDHKTIYLSHFETLHTLIFLKATQYTESMNRL